VHTLIEPDPLAGLNELARQIAAAGVKHLTGEVLIDDRLFDKAEGTGSGPAALSPIMVNDNVVDFVITPAAKAAWPATVDWRPKTTSIVVDAQVETVATGKEAHLTVTAPAAGRMVVRGTIAEGSQPLVRVQEVEDAAQFARALFIEALRRAGVIVDASPLGGNGFRRAAAGGMRTINAVKWSELPLEDAIKITRGNGSRKIAIFEDPNCGYCKRFERDLLGVTDITVYVFLYPILAADSVEKSKAVWCKRGQGQGVARPHDEGRADQRRHQVRDADREEPRAGPRQASGRHPHHHLRERRARTGRHDACGLREEARRFEEPAENGFLEVPSGRASLRRRRHVTLRKQHPHAPLRRIFPAWLPAASPNPQKKSARTPPAIAPPVSCATMRRFRGSLVLGHVVARKTGTPERHDAGVDGDRALGRERHALGAQRPGQVARQLAEEDVARIRVQHLLCARRIAPHPVLDSLHRCAFGRQLATLDEDAPERAERVSVLVGIAHAHAFAVVELHLSGALDVQEESVHRVIDPHEARRPRIGGSSRSISPREKYGTTRLPSRRPRSLRPRRSGYTDDRSMVRRSPGTA